MRGGPDGPPTNPRKEVPDVRVPDPASRLARGCAGRARPRCWLYSERHDHTVPVVDRGIAGSQRRRRRRPRPSSSSAGSSRWTSPRSPRHCSSRTGPWPRSASGTRSRRLPVSMCRSSTSGRTSPTRGSSTPTPTGSAIATTTDSRRRRTPWMRRSAGAGPRSPSSGSTRSGSTSSSSSPPTTPSRSASTRISLSTSTRSSSETGTPIAKPGLVDDRLRVQGVKIHLDDGSGNIINWEPADLTETIARADEAGWQVSVHAMSSEALKLLLDAYEEALGPTGPNPLHHRVEHALQVKDEQLARLVAMDIPTVIHLDGAPDWLLGDRSLAEVDRDDPGELVWLGRWRDFVDAGLHVASATDAPWTFPDFEADRRHRPAGGPDRGRDGRPGSLEPGDAAVVARPAVDRRPGVAGGDRRRGLRPSATRRGAGTWRRAPSATARSRAVMSPAPPRRDQGGLLHRQLIGRGSARRARAIRHATASRRRHSSMAAGQALPRP